MSAPVTQAPQAYGQPPMGQAGAMPMQQMQQQGQQQWMDKPTNIPGCPPGLEYLTQLDQLVVKQIVELLEVLTGWETNNKYKIFNSVGQQCFYAAEETPLCMRLCCGPARGFTIHITDNYGQEVMRIVRRFKCCAGCCWCANCDCCAFEIEVEAPVGNVIGSVRQSQSCWKPAYMIYDGNRDLVAQIAGPCCPCGCVDINFPVLSADGNQEIGMITKQWTGLIKETFTDADTFSVSFPKDMDVKLKGTMIGALFLIDFMYFEKQNSNH